MLIMWRRTGEGLLAGVVEIEILDARPDRVKLGIKAPADCIIERRETQITKQQNISSALNSSQTSLEDVLNALSR
jgi:carbon storage regulator CsrA